jgi:Sigma-70, region 4
MPKMSARSEDPLAGRFLRAGATGVAAGAAAGSGALGPVGVANQRAALVMQELEGRSYAEIAQILDLSVGAGMYRRDG